MAETKINPFVVSDQKSINVYGFRVLIEGIDTSQFERNPIMLYMHNRNSWKPNGDEVIGRWVKISKEDGRLLATPEFDEADDFAKKIKGKVERGYLKMASIGFDIIETSTDPAHMLKGQTRPTVIKCKLKEISIVDIAADDNALQLYSGGKSVTLNDALPVLDTNSKTLNNPNIMNEIKIIAVQLGLKEDAKLPEILTAISKQKQEALDATTKLAAIESKKKEEQATESAKLIGKLKAAKLIDDAQEATYKALFAADHQNAKTIVETMLSSAKGTQENSTGLESFLKDVGSSKGAIETQGMSFEKLSAENPKALEKIQKQNPALFNELLAEYSAPQ